MGEIPRLPDELEAVEQSRKRFVLMHEGAVKEFSSAKEGAEWMLSAEGRKFMGEMGGQFNLKEIQVSALEPEQEEEAGNE